jgi:Uma2 family endonuclease
MSTATMAAPVTQTPPGLPPIVIASQSTSQYPCVAKMTVEQFHRALEGKSWGDGRRLMLIHGVVMEKEPMTPALATVMRNLARILRKLETGTRIVSMQLPFVTEHANDLVPDFVILPGPNPDYRSTHPNWAELVIEVANTSLHDDLTTKAELYAKARIPDYWVIDITKQEVHVLRDPQPIGAGGASYRSQTIFKVQDTVTALIEPSHGIPVATIFA